jgi:hypothetical protein
VCYGCHGTAASAPTSERAPGFHSEEGVTCERCHGPGERHVVAYRDHGRATEKLRIPTRDDCMGCHVEKASHAMLNIEPFAFEAFWKNIRHSTDAGTQEGM